MTNIFISYNPKAAKEQSLALRLQTLGALYGFSVSLPDRIGAAVLKVTTKQRIENASIFLVFSTRNLSKNIKDEIKYALSLNKKIIVVYDKDVGKNLDIAGVTEIEYNHNSDSPQKIADEIAKALYPQVPSTRSKPKPLVKQDDAMLAFLFVALGLLLLAAFSKDKE